MDIRSIVVSYSVLIEEAPKREWKRVRATLFVATLMDDEGLSVTSYDPEHYICHEMTLKGYPDGPVEFRRAGGTVCFTHSSVHRLGEYRIAMDEHFPMTRCRRKPPPRISSNRPEGAIVHGQTQHGWYLPTPENLGALET